MLIEDLKLQLSSNRAERTPGMAAVSGYMVEPDPGNSGSGNEDNRGLDNNASPLFVTKVTGRSMPVEGAPPSFAAVRSNASGSGPGSGANSRVQVLPSRHYKELLANPTTFIANSCLENISHNVANRCQNER